MSEEEKTTTFTRHRFFFFHVFLPSMCLLLDGVLEPAFNLMDNYLSLCDYVIHPVNMDVFRASRLPNHYAVDRPVNYCHTK